MDVNKYLKTITNLNKYISFTADVQNKRIDLKIPFNLSTILSLKNIRSIEIEYFNKCEENGGATKIVELLLRSPPSKTWGLLGGELVCLLQYWLEAIRKHLILHNVHWWTFLKLILKFIKVISVKDVSLNKILVEGTAECLLDLATHGVPDARQRCDILQTFNAISADASRTVRFAYKEKLQDYFIKLSTLLAAAGDLPLQHRMLESLLRWLLPRQEPAVRRAAAARWFPAGTYSRTAVVVFLERRWQDFVKDARDFLNAQNKYGGLVTSVVCRSFSVGGRVCFSATQAKYKSECWLDVNSSTRCLSISLDPKWDTLGGDGGGDTVFVCDENTIRVELKQESEQVLITASVLELSRVYPFSGDVIGDSNTSDIHIVVSTRSDISRLDKSLRGIFGEKYKMSLDIETIALCRSPDDKLSNSDVIDGTEEDIRLSMPPEVTMKKHSGYVVKSRNVGSWNSPSTVSTSSLAQLHERLAALPRYTFDKEPVSVCALPHLSTVSEVSETEGNHTNNSSLSTIKYRRFGICQKKISKDDSKTSHGTSDDSHEKRNVSSVVNDDENSISCLLLATIGSVDDSVISDALSRLPKNIPCNTDNIVELLAQEALENSIDKQTINIDNLDNNKNPNVQQEPEQPGQRICANKKPMQSTHASALPNEQHPIDESSNEIVENTPISWVQVKRSKRKNDKNTSKSDDLLSEENDGVKLIHNFEVVENFFSQHVSENRNGDIVISPSLARKINETSSESSDTLDQCIFIEERSHNHIVQKFEIGQPFIPDSDIIECVNAMLDKVCQDLDKCAKYIDLVEELREVDNNSHYKRNLRKDSRNKIIEEHGSQNVKNNAKDNISKPKGKPSNSVKLKFTKRKSVTCKKSLKNTTKPKKEQPFTVMSPIIERSSDDGGSKNVDTRVESPKSPITGPLLRRKRKLYSPKEETCQQKTNVDLVESLEDDNITKVESKVYTKTPNSSAVCYKELEQERKKHIRKCRTRLALKKPVLMDSPKTSKLNQIFDSLKEVIDGEPVKLIDKTKLRNAIYNYTSESEDEDVEKNRKTHSKKVDNSVAKSVKNTKKVDKTMKNVEIIEERNKKGVKGTPKLRTRRTIKKGEKENISKVPGLLKQSLEDERMRGEAPNILNTSLDIEYPKVTEKSSNINPEPVLNDLPRMECIDENTFKPDDQNIKENQHKSKTKRTLSLKRNKDIPKVNLDLSMADNDGTISPLPGLVVETILTTEFDTNDSISANMFQKFKEIYKGKQVTDSDANATQNLLSDTNEPIDYSHSTFNVTEELNRGDCKKHNTKVQEKSIKKLDKRNIKVERKFQIAKSHAVKKSEIIQLSASDGNSGRTMDTLGNSHSPITAHGDFDEVPPNSILLNEVIQPRIVEQEYLDQSIKDFFGKLTEQLNESNKEEEDDNEPGGSFKDDNKTKDDRSSVKSGSTNSPVVLITRLSPEYIRSQISPNSSLVNSNTSKTNDNIDSSPKIAEDNFENIKDDCDNAEVSDKMSTKNTRARKSTISPIKLGEDFKSNNVKTVTSPPSESEDICVKRIKRIFSRNKQPIAESNSASIEINKPAYSRRTARINTATSSHNLEQGREESTSSRVDSSKASKRNCSPVLRCSKRSRYGEENNNYGSTITESSSISTVKEWFKRNGPTCTADSITLSNKENIKNVLEKLDTTLVEIHHNTSKRFINMFVDATTQLNDLKENRQQLQRQVAAEIMSSVVKIVDDKFLELNTKLQSMDDQFMETLKKRAHDLIREECKQKRAMVTLLKEDVQAVLDHLEKTGGSQ